MPALFSKPTSPAALSPAAVFYAWMGRVCAPFVLFALLVFVNPVLPGMDWDSRYLLTFLVLLAATVLERQRGGPAGARKAFLPVLGVVLGLSITSQACGLAAGRNDLLYNRGLGRKAAALPTAPLVTDIFWLGLELTASSLPQAQFLVRSEGDGQLFLAAQRQAAGIKPTAEFTFMGTSAGLAALARTASEASIQSQADSAFWPVATWNGAGLQFAHFVLARSPLPTAKAAKARHVLALYYPWYGTPTRSGQWLHQEPDKTTPKKMADHPDFPARGPYDSTDPAVIERHLSEAQAAGIDTLVCSWWGRTDRTDAAIRLLLRRASAHSLKVCVLWERPGAAVATTAKAPTAPQPAAAQADLAYLLGTLAKNDAYLRVGGRPVVFLYPGTSQALTPEQWSAAAGRAATQVPPGVLLIGAGRSPAEMARWDGLYALSTDRPMYGAGLAECARIQAETFRPLIARAARSGGISVESVLPGYDNRWPPPPGGRPAGLVVGRRDGGLYRTLWEQAIQDGPDWVLVNSFNEWHNGTEIEPSVEMGSRYLALTRQFALRFKGLPKLQGHP